MIQSTKNEVFWTWVRRIDLILHIIIELNVFQRLATQPGHERAFKSPKKALLNDPKCQEGGFWPLS